MNKSYFVAYIGHQLKINVCLYTYIYIKINFKVSFLRQVLLSFKKFIEEDFLYALEISSV